MVILVAVVVVVVVLCCGAGCALSGGPGQAGESIESIAPRRGAPELSPFSFSITNLDDFSPAFSALVVFPPAKSYGKVSRSQTATETSSRQLVTTACHKMPELYWSAHHLVAAQPACAPDGALCVCTSLAHEIRGSQPLLFLKLACACQQE